MLLPSSSSQPHYSVQQPAPSQGTRGATVPLSAWREYGYWARPVIGGVEVRNSDSTLCPVPFIPRDRGELTAHYRSVSAGPPPDHVLRDVDVDEMFRSLRGTRGSPHPENWVPGLSHPSLPPKPPYWRSPDINEPPATAPWECQLNPFLEHIRTGLPILYFDVRLGEESIIFETGDVRHVPVSNSNLYQPATYPFVTEVRFRCKLHRCFPDAERTRY